MGGPFDSLHGLLPFFWCGASLFGLLAMAFWIWMLVDCLQRDFSTENEKIIWVLVIALLNWIGALVYFFIGRENGTKRNHGR